MYQSAELVHWMQNPSKALIPASAVIELTNLCNQDCYYCNTAEFRAQNPVQQKLDDYMLLLERLDRWRSYKPNSYGSLHTITFAGGGEPTLFKGYEQLVEKTIDLGFLVGIVTNGTQLNKLVEHVDHNKLKKISWIGVDTDAGTEELYETIRKSIPKKSLFSQVLNNITQLTNIGVNVDLKILLSEYNTDDQALHDIFQYAKDTNVRQIYFRPVLYNNQIYPMDQMITKLESLAQEYRIQIRVSDTRFINRNYTKCHQMFQRPVFSADGKIYSCCDNTGNPNFSIGSWNQGDFRDVWLGEQHMKVYNSINTKLCAPCGPNKNNVEIQNIINDPIKIESLYR